MKVDCIRCAWMHEWCLKKLVNDNIVLDVFIICHCSLLQCLCITSAVLAGTHFNFVISFKCEQKNSCHNLISNPHISVKVCKLKINGIQSFFRNSMRADDVKNGLIKNLMNWNVDKLYYVNIIRVLLVTVHLKYQRSAHF